MLSFASTEALYVAMPCAQYLSSNIPNQSQLTNTHSTLDRNYHHLDFGEV